MPPFNRQSLHFPPLHGNVDNYCSNGLLFPQDLLSIFQRGGNCSILWTFWLFSNVLYCIFCLNRESLSIPSQSWVGFPLSLLQSSCKRCIINIPSWTQSRGIYCGFLKHLGYSLKDFEESDSWTVWSIQPEMLPKRNYHIIILFFPKTQSLRNNVILCSIMQRIEHYSHKTLHCLVADKNY